MTAITTKDYRSHLGNPAFRAWLTLNYQPSRWASSEWLDSQLPGMCERLRHHEGTQALLKERCDLQGLDWGYFSLPLASLLFAPVDALQHLMRALGAMCFSLNRKLIIEKNFLLALSKTLPDATLNFLEQSGPMLLTNQPLLLEKIAERFTLWNSQQQELIDLEGLGEIIFFKTLDFAAKKSGEPLKIDHWRKYYRLKMPNRTADVSSDHRDLPNADIHILVLIRKIVRHLEPECSVLLN